MDWLKIDKVTIFEGRDENGNRYLSQFLRDYKEAFPSSNPQAGCKKCLDDQYQKLIKHISTMKKVNNESGYVLKQKYQNIPLNFGSPILVNNSNMTEKYAQELLKRKNGANLFETIPAKKGNPSNEDDKDLSKLTREQLDERATKIGLDPTTYANKDEISLAITTAEEAEVNE